MLFIGLDINQALIEFSQEIDNSFTKNGRNQ
jgi:hypothetical protein